MKKQSVRILAFAIGVAISWIGALRAQSLPDGSKARPLRVMLVPADGGTEDGTKADFPARLQCGEPGHGSQLRHQSGPKLRGGVEGMANGLADIGFFGPVTYTQAKERGGAELLAVGVEKGQSVYCSALFVRANSPIKTIADLKGKRAAFGDVNSTVVLFITVFLLDRLSARLI